MFITKKITLILLMIGGVYHKTLLGHEESDKESTTSPVELNPHSEKDPLPLIEQKLRLGHIILQTLFFFGLLCVFLRAKGNPIQIIENSILWIIWAILNIFINVYQHAWATAANWLPGQIINVLFLGLMFLLFILLRLEINTIVVGALLYLYFGPWQIVTLFNAILLAYYTSEEEQGELPWEEKEDPATLKSDESVLHAAQ